MKRFFPFLLVMLALRTASAATWYVDDSVAVPGDGTSWETSLKTIQAGINAASHSDTVVVAEGTYVENIHFDGKNITLTSKDPMNPRVVDQTIIDGNQAGSVVTFSGNEDDTCVLSGFTIRNGKAEHGGGIRGTTSGYGTYATIQYNTITDNAAEAWGGGLSYCYGLIRNNTIDNNTAYHGGGIYYCTGTIQDNTITDNSVSGWGGGLADCGGTVQNNTITGNSALYGGGLYQCSGIVQYNTIATNSAVSQPLMGACGGGLYFCLGTVQNNAIIDNHSDVSGGGGELCRGILRNNTIAGNSAVLWGGGLSRCEGAILENNTITANSAGEEGGGVYDCDGPIRNCILWTNTAPSGPQLYDSSIPTYSCIQGWVGDPDKMNFPQGPRFLDPDGPDDNPATYADNNYRLAADSPCVDTGSNEPWMTDATDRDGNPRIWMDTVDIGAYEYGSWPFRIVAIRMQITGPELWWTCRPGQTYTIWSCPDPSAAAWTEEATRPYEGEITSWIDTDSSGRIKFYRIELNP